MRLRRWIPVGLLLLVMVGWSGFSAEPLLTARGELWASVDFIGRSLEVHVVFNVKDRGDPEDDRGNLSIRVFDKASGKLLAVGISADVWDVKPVAAGAAFMADMRVTAGDFPVPGVFAVTAIDSIVDQIVLGGLWLTAERGGIVVL